jgi:hypothetical protein
VSEHLDAVVDERANGRQSPALVSLLEELDARVRQLEDNAENAAHGVKAKAKTGGE